MSSFWWNFHHWLHWKLSKWQLPVQPVMKISSKWRHFRFSVCGATRPHWVNENVSQNYVMKSCVTNEAHHLFQNINTWWRFVISTTSRCDKQVCILLTEAMNLFELNKMKFSHKCLEGSIVYILPIYEYILLKLIFVRLCRVSKYHIR